MTPHNPGDRVVAPHPSGRPVIGTVSEVLHDGDVMVRCGDGAFRASASEVLPAMPRDRRDIDKYGQYWWCGDKVGRFGGDRKYFFFGGSGDFVSVYPSDDWRGPVGSPPEVRS